MPQPLRDQVFISYSHQNRWQDDATPSKFLNDSLSEHETLRRLQRDWQQPFRDLSVRDPVKLFEAEAFQDLL